MNSRSQFAAHLHLGLRPSPRFLRRLIQRLQQNLRGDVFDVLGRQRGAAQIGGVMNDVINQAQETIDKVVPGPWIVMQADQPSLTC